MADQTFQSQQFAAQQDARGDAAMAHGVEAVGRGAVVGVQAYQENRRMQHEQLRQQAGMLIDQQKLELDQARMQEEQTRTLMLARSAEARRMEAQARLMFEREKLGLMVQTKTGAAAQESIALDNKLKAARVQEIENKLSGDEYARDRENQRMVRDFTLLEKGAKLNEEGMLDDQSFAALKSRVNNKLPRGMQEQPPPQQLSLQPNQGSPAKTSFARAWKGSDPEADSVHFLAEYLSKHQDSELTKAMVVTENGQMRPRDQQEFGLLAGAAERMQAWRESRGLPPMTSDAFWRAVAISVKRYGGVKEFAAAVDEAAK